jgi:hypothetical protein
MTTSSKKCNSPFCTVTSTIDESASIKCHGYCKGVFHACCIGLPRQFSTVTAISKFLSTHFICDACQAVKDIIFKIDEVWTLKFKTLTDKLDNMQDTTRNQLKSNENAFIELSGNVESFSRTITDLDELHKTKIPFEISLMSEMAPIKQSAATQTDNNVSFAVNEINDGWRTINGKKIWKQDWTDYDKIHLLRRTEVTKTTKSKKINKKHSTKSSRNLEKQPRQPFDNFYDILSEFDHQEPPTLQGRRGNQRHQHQQRQTPQLRQNTPGMMKQQSRYRPKTNKQSQHNFRETSTSPFQHQQQRKLLQPINFVPGPVLNPPPFNVPHAQLQSTHQNQQYQTKSWDHISVLSNSSSIQQRPTFAVPVDVHQPPPNIHQNLTTPSMQYPLIQPATSFIDPLLPAVVRTTQISAMENGRYALSRLHDTHVLKNVRIFLAYLHDNTNVCHEGFTAAHCKALIGSKGLPTDVASLKRLYIQYNVSFGNLREEEVIHELQTYRNYLISSRVNYLQRSREANSKFYNNRQTQKSNF